MGLVLANGDYERKKIKGKVNWSLPIHAFQNFNPSILELGDISKEATRFGALAAIFDLENFTSFCNQIDPHLVIPEYLTAFLEWLFESISTEFTQKIEGDDVHLWCKLPFFGKFMGDGVLFLWKTEDLAQDVIGNIVISLHNVCNDFTESFLPQIKKTVATPPRRLRCGIARGQIISVGDIKDFVGPCINVASRLQKIGKFSFAFSRRGFDLEKCFSKEARKEYTLIKSPIRGVGDEELLYVRSEELNQLTEEERALLLP